MSYPKSLRWWFEEWKPRHRGDCDCKGCTMPLISSIKSQLLWQKNPDNPYHHERLGITLDWLSGLASRTHCHRSLKLLQKHNLIHICYCSGRHRHAVYILGAAESCPDPKYH